MACSQNLCHRLILLVCILLVCHGRVAAAEGKTALRIGYLPLLSQLPLVVSYENDHLNFDKIRLTLHRYNSFTSLEAALRVGAIDAASIPVPIALNIAAAGHPIRILGTCHQGGSRLVSKKKTDLKKIRGALIGVPGLDSNESLRLDEVLERLDLQAGLDYKTIEIPFTIAIKDLKANKLDAIYLPEPYGTIAENEKIAQAVEGQNGQLTAGLTTVVTIRSKNLEQNKAGVEEWLKSLVNSCRSIEKDISQSGGLQTAIIQASYFQFPEAVVSAALSQRKGDLKFDHFIPEVKLIKKYAAQAAKLKLLEKSVDIDTLVNFELMRKASQNLT